MIITVYAYINLIKYSYLFCSSVHPHVHVIVFYMFYKTIPSFISQWRGYSEYLQPLLSFFFKASMFTQHILESCVMKNIKIFFFKECIEKFHPLSHNSFLWESIKKGVNIVSSKLKIWRKRDERKMVFKKTLGKWRGFPLQVYSSRISRHGYVSPCVWSWMYFSHQFPKRKWETYNTVKLRIKAWHSVGP